MLNNIYLNAQPVFNVSDLSVLHRAIGHWNHNLSLALEERHWCYWYVGLFWEISQISILQQGNAKKNYIAKKNCTTLAWIAFLVSHISVLNFL